MTADLSSRLDRLLIEHADRYPYLQVQDVYKLLFQAAMGSGHAVPDANRTLTRLKEEMDHLSPDPDQPLIEQISPEVNLKRRVVRVNLRAYLAVSNDITPLLDAFVRTANEFAGSIPRLDKYISLLTQGTFPAALQFSTKEFENFASKIRKQDYPAIHHSGIYTRHYQPAYRVVAAYLMAPILENIHTDRPV